MDAILIEFSQLSFNALCCTLSINTGCMDICAFLFQILSVSVLERKRRRMVCMYAGLNLSVRSSVILEYMDSLLPVSQICVVGRGPFFESSFTRF